jgi:hypothetical protein
VKLTLQQGLAAAATLSAASAAAYLMPATGIIKALVDDHQAPPIHSMIVRGSYTFFGDQAAAVATALKAVNAGGETTVAAELDFKMPGKCAVTLQAPSAIEADAATAINNSGKVKTLGPEVLLIKIHAALACPLLYQRSGAKGDAAPAWQSFLEGLGVDLQVVSMVRFSGDLAKPQFWVSKGDKFDPTRLIAKVDGTLYDVRLTDFTSPASGEWHPRQVDIYRGETLLSRFLAEKADVNVKVSDAIF